MLSKRATKTKRGVRAERNELPWRHEDKRRECERERARNFARAPCLWAIVGDVCAEGLNEVERF